MPSPLRRIGTALGLLALCLISILRIARPPAPVPATAPDTVFSAERAMRHVEAIAVRPHGVGMPDHDRVRDYIVAQLAAMGLHAQIQRTTGIGTRYPDAGRIQNILAWIPGTDPSGKALLLVAHYDGVGAGPAAADDGAGCAALLETLRALRARKKPLAHDVFVLFSDGEETGLLGSAAFVREHPWAKDVAMVLNFEARGTSGRDLMFETGPGNLDAARLLRSAGNATSGSVFTTVYRTLPNDTDLSELASLGLPAMNFAFVSGVERYHTSRDDLAHLDSGSVQHEGDEMLGLATLIGNGPLPRPATADGVFFDLPVVGLVVYPEWLAVPLALLALLLVALLVVLDRPAVFAGMGATLAAAILAAVVGFVVGTLVKGPAEWSSAWAAAIVCFAVAVTLGGSRAVSRWASATDVRSGALVLWAALALATSIVAPGASYVFVWPLLFAAAAALMTRGIVVAEWIAAAVTLLILAGLIYGVSVLLLGIAVPGAVATAILTSLIVALLLPLVGTVTAGARWGGAGWFAAGGVALAIIGLATAHPSADHPLRSALVYAENADGAGAWLGSSLGAGNAWVRSVVSPESPAPAWTRRLEGEGNGFVGRQVARAPLDAPNATLVRDTVIKDARRIVLRVTAPAGATDVVLRATGASVATASVDDRVVDATRYRYPPRDWTMQYWAVPDSGVIVALSVPIGGTIALELAAWRPGIPSVQGLTIPPRPASVVPSQRGDATVVYRVLRF